MKINLTDQQTRRICRPRYASGYGFHQWLLTTCVILFAGCSLVDSIPNFSDRSFSLLKKKSNELPTIAVPSGSTQLEIVFIERPPGDPLTKDLLWQEVDQVSALSSDTRKQLMLNGFRIGHVSSSPPRALQTLLEMTAEVGDSIEAGGIKRLSGRRVWLRPSTAAEVQTSEFYDHCTMTVFETADDVGETEEYKNARCVFRVRAKRLQDGWANVEFTPEIHSGQHQMRHVATAGGWEMKSSQEVMPLFSQKFSIMLNLGEMAVIAADPYYAKADSIGRHFFLGGVDNPKVQRLLIVRLADVQNVDPVFSE